MTSHNWPQERKQKKPSDVISTATTGMVRALKYHEQKLLKKADYVNWKHDKSAKVAAVMRKYSISKREHFVAYMRLVGRITSLVAKLRKLDAADPVRVRVTAQLLERLFAMGVVASPARGLAQIDRLSVSSIARRRLPVVMVRMHMVQHLREAVTFVEQGHVRVGPTVVTDPALLVTRSMEDFVTWVDDSKIKRKVLRYRDQVDDYDLL
jgi:U3 small nucleolar ribonucleoprotein protein IMP3